MNGKQLWNMYEDILKKNASMQYPNQAVNYPGYEKALEFAKKNAPVIWCDRCADTMQTELFEDRYVCMGCRRTLSNLDDVEVS